MLNYKPLLFSASLAALAVGAYGSHLAAARAASVPSCPYVSATYRTIADGEKPPALRKATPDERKAAAASIEAQLKAFHDDDYAKAEKYQSTGLREQLNDRGQFRAMMKARYPQFAKYKSVTFGEARATPKGEQVEIQVTVTGEDKVVVKAVYVMAKEDDGYKVASVFTPPSPPAKEQDPRNVI